MKKILYFDNAATTKISEKALDAYISASKDYWGNPSSLHQAGQEAHSRLEDDRNKIASCLQVKPQDLTFTASSTEANSIILQSFLWSPQQGQILIPSIEHSAVKGFERLFREKGWTVSTIDAPKGFVDPDQVASLLNPKTRLVCMMLVNNVTGSIQPVGEIVKVCRAYEKRTGRKIHVHTDATQALGKIPFNLGSLGVDSAAFSAHKLQGPKGVGLLYNIDPSIQGLSRGGGQEHALRPGTENTAGIASMAVAISDALENLNLHQQTAQHLNALCRKELDGVVSFLSPGENASPWILNITTDKLPSEVLTRMLSDKGICVSSGSACSNNAQGKEESIITAMHFSPKEAKGSIRISFGYQTTDDEAMLLCLTLKELLGRN